MADPEAARTSVATELERILTAYLDGRQAVADFLAWEAEFSLDSESVGAVRSLLDRLSIVAAEVCDGARDEGEFRALAREAVTTRLAKERAAVAEPPASYRSSGDSG